MVTLSAVAGKWWPLFHPLLLFIRKKCHPNLKKWNGKKALWPKRFSGCILFFHTFDYQRILGKLCHSGRKWPKVTRLQFQNYLGWYRRVLAPPMATYVAQWDLFRGIFPHCVLCRIRRQSIIVWVHKSWLLWNLEERNYYCSSSLSLSFFFTNVNLVRDEGCESDRIMTEYLTSTVYSTVNRRAAAVSKTKGVCKG